MDRLFQASTDFGPFKKGNLVVLDDSQPDQLGWINTGYLHEIKPEETGSGEDQGAHRAG